MCNTCTGRGTLQTAGCGRTHEFQNTHGRTHANTHAHTHTHARTHAHTRTRQRPFRLMCDAPSTWRGQALPCSAGARRSQTPAPCHSPGTRPFRIQRRHSLPQPPTEQGATPGTTAGAKPCPPIASSRRRACPLDSSPTELSPEVDKSIFNTSLGTLVLRPVPPSLPRAISVEPWRPRRSRPRRPTSRRPRASRCASLCLLTACGVCVRALAPLWPCTRVCAGARVRRAFCRGGGMLVDAADPGHAGRRARRLTR